MTASMPARTRAGGSCAASGAAARAASVIAGAGSAPATATWAATSSNASGEPNDSAPFPADTDNLRFRPRR